MGFAWVLLNVWRQESENHCQYARCFFEILQFFYNDSTFKTAHVMYAVNANMIKRNRKTSGLIQNSACTFILLRAPFPSDTDFDHLSGMLNHVPLLSRGQGF